MDRIKKIRTWCFWLGTILLMLSAIGFAQYYTDYTMEYRYSGDYIMGVEVVAASDLEKQLQGREREILAENDMLFFNDTLIPYDRKTSTLYISQSLNSDGWEGMITAVSAVEKESEAQKESEVQKEQSEQLQLYFQADEYGVNKAEAIRTGHEFKLVILKAESYTEVSVIVSGMPIIAIDTDYVEMPQELVYEDDPDEYVYGNEAEHYGKIWVFDPNMEKSDRYMIHESSVHFHEKGALSASFPKKGYSLHLIDEDGKQVKESLLGMRNDDDWKLNALYTDPSKIREKAASSIWEAIDAVSEVSEAGPVMEYVELLLNGEYVGLYTLVEPVDRKKCGLDSNDSLYKIVNWDIPDDAQMQESIDLGYRVQYPIRLRYPEQIRDYDRAWYPMRDYLNSFYREVDIPYEQGVSKVNLRNVVDYNIFLMATAACDNSYKNLFLAANIKEDGSYVMTLHPWDVDYTFGNYCVGPETLTATAFLEDYQAEYIDEAFEELAEAAPEQMRAAFTPVWNDYRSSILKNESMITLVRYYMDYIVETGAMARDTQKWPECENSTDIEYLEEYITNRMNWLDEYWEEYFR